MDTGFRGGSFLADSSNLSYKLIYRMAFDMLWHAGERAALGRFVHEEQTINKFD
jgi:hypothetical protein